MIIDPPTAPLTPVASPRSSDTSSSTGSPTTTKKKKKNMKKKTSGGTWWLWIFRLSTGAATSCAVMVVSLVALRVTKEEKGLCGGIRELHEVPFSGSTFAPECPFVIRDAVTDDEWLNGKFWSKLRQTKMTTPFKYDVMERDDGEVVFRYWDNATLLATSIDHDMVGQLHGKVDETDRRRAIDAIFATTTKTKRIAARYGGPIAAFAEELDIPLWHVIGKYVPKEIHATTRRIGLWLSGPRTASSPHYDSFHNFYTVVAGEKIIQLAPPTEAQKSFDCYPATHPEARQAKVDAFAPKRPTETRGPPTRGKRYKKPAEETKLKDAMTVRLRPGDAVFIPAGWIHRISVAPGHRPAAAVSVTTLPNEFHHFDTWVRQPSAIPFLHGKVWSPRQLNSALRRFVNQIHQKIFVDTNETTEFASPRAFFHTDTIFRDLVRRSYDSETRRSVGLPTLEEERGSCPYTDPLSDADRHLVDKAADDVVDVFTTVYRPSLRFIYLPPFFENILTNLAAPRPAHNVTLIDKISRILDFVDTCLLDHHEEASSSSSS